VWVAAPGEAIISTYPFSTYGAGWGTSFSAPFVSGGVALLLQKLASLNESQAATAIAHAQSVGPDMGNGRLDLVQALQATPGGSNNPDFNVSAGPSSTSIPAGQAANFTVSAIPAGGFNQTVTWSCTGAPPQATCQAVPSTATLDGVHATTAKVMLQTTARSLMPLLGPPRTVRPIPFWVTASCLVWLAFCAMLWTLLRRSRERVWVSAALLLCAAVICASCGGGGPGPPPPPPPPQGTPAGTYTLTVTGSSGNLSHSKTVKVIVQ